jgi:hypothetical protein
MKTGLTGLGSVGGGGAFTTATLVGGAGRLAMLLSIAAFFAAAAAARTRGDFVFGPLASTIAFPFSVALSELREAEARPGVAALVAGVFSPGLNFSPASASGEPAGLAGMEAQYCTRSTKCRACEGGRGFTANSFGRYY